MFVEFWSTGASRRETPFTSRSVGDSYALGSDTLDHYHKQTDADLSHFMDPAHLQGDQLYMAECFW